jgi:hypothetical protein
MGSAVDVLQAAAAGVLRLEVWELPLEAVWVLGVQNAGMTLGLRDMESWFPRPSSHLPPCAAWACLLQTALPAAVAPLNLHYRRQCRYYSSLYSQAAVVQGLTGVPVVCPCQAQAAHLQWP